MDFREIVYASRSVRRFDGAKPLDPQQLLELVDLARVAPCAKNEQWLRYAIVDAQKGWQNVFPSLGWAGFLTDWAGPRETERPGGYIVIVEDGNVGKGLPQDAGIAAQTIMLGAQAKGISGCIIYSIKREQLSEALGLTKGQRIALVLALGYAAETVTLVDLPENGSTKYWREGNRHFVPKRKLEEILIKVEE